MMFPSKSPSSQLSFWIFFPPFGSSSGHSHSAVGNMSMGRSGDSTYLTRRRKVAPVRFFTEQKTSRGLGADGDEVLKKKRAKTGTRPIKIHLTTHFYSMVIW